MLRTIQEKERMGRNAFCVWSVSGTAQKTLYEDRKGKNDGNRTIKSRRVQEKCGFKYQWRSENVDVSLMHEKRTGQMAAEKFSCRLFMIGY